VAFITLGVMTEVSALLKAMHPLGRSGGGIMDIVGDPDRARSVADAWQTWFTEPVEAASARPPISPRTVSLWYLGLDSLAFLPAYVLFFGVLFRRAKSALESEASSRAGRGEAETAASRSKVDEAVTPTTFSQFALTAWLALGIFAFVPLFDLLENGMLWRFIERRIEACPTGTCSGVGEPGDAFVFALRMVSYLKLGAFFLSLVVAILPLAVWARLGADWFRSVRPAVRRLRGQVVLLLLFFVLMRFNPQTKDLFRGWDWIHAIMALAAVFLAGVVTWSIGWRVTYVRRGRDAAGNVLPKPDRARAHALTIGVGMTLLILGALGIWFDLAPRGLVIPGAFLLILARFDAAGQDIAVSAPTEVLGGIRDQVPAVLAAAWPILLAYFAARALFPLRMYDDAGSFLSTTAVYVVWVLLVPAVSIALLYYVYLAWVRRGREERRRDREEVPRPTAPAGRSGASKIGQAVSSVVTTTVPTTTPRQPVLVDLLIVLGALLWIRVVMNPWAVGQALGAITLVVAFFAVLSAVVGRVSLSIERNDPPGLFRILGMQRTPVFLLVVLWLVLTAVVPSIGRDDFHDIRRLESGVDPSVSSMGSLEVFRRWERNQQELATPGAAGQPRRAVPLILVASEGGGIKAAMWTALVLDCVLSPDPIVDRCPSHDRSRLPSVFAESGVSGGSVGLVTYTRYAADPALSSEPGDWIGQRLGGDFVSSSIAWQLYVETPRAWLQFDAGMDRAEVLERAWEQAWERTAPYGIRDALFGGALASGGPLADGFRALWANNPDVPLLLLNGFSIQDGCKFVTTPVDGNGVESDSLNCVAAHAGLEVPARPTDGRPGFLSGSRVLSDLLCAPADDVRLSTAALLSARFPYVSPSGRVLSCPSPETAQRAINVVDGGYGENTGAGSALELWDSIRPLVDQYNGDPTHGACIVPALLQIQSGYGPSADVPSTSQDELVVPPKGIVKAPNGFTVWQRNAAQLAVLDPLPFTGSATEPARQGVYALVYPYAHPGTEAPLGWSLSPQAQSDLKAQLSAKGNVDALDALEEFLNDPGTCAPAERTQAFGSSG
jgi:hypothetical protein